MDKFSHNGIWAAFFMLVAVRIMYIIGEFVNPVVRRFFYVLNLRGRARGGLAFWRGDVFSRGVADQGAGWRYAYKFAAKHGLTFREAAALLRLAVGLPGHSKSGSAFGGAVVDGGECGKKGGHFVAPVNKARRLVVASPSWERFTLPTYKRQRVIDALGLHTQKNTRFSF